MRKLLFLLIFLCPLLHATQYEVGPGQTFTTIQSCMTAIAPGDICNAHASTYNENNLTWGAAGTVGNYKTLQNNGTDIITINCTSSPCYTPKSHTKIIGNSPSSINLNYTGAGADPTYFRNVHGTSVDDVIISNVTITISGGTGEGFCGTIADSDLLTITHTVCHIAPTVTGSMDGWDTLFASHMTFDNNLIYGDDCSGSDTHLEDGLVLSGTNITIGPNNIFHDGCSFDNHPDAIVVQGDGDRGGSPTASVTVKQNTIYNFTQGIYNDAIHNNMTSLLDYDNVIYELSTYRYGGVASKMNGIVNDGENVSGGTYNIVAGIYNNVVDVKLISFYCLRMNAASSALTIKNNIWLTPIFTGVFLNCPGVTIDYNYYSQGDTTPIKWDPTGGGGGTNYSLAAFQGSGHGETNGATGTANLNSNYTEKSASPTRGIGLDLTAIFTVDRNGATWPSGSAWDIGAFLYSAPPATVIYRRR